jgi:uncharacterized metal-binding protein YceD (DUF177 family)
MSQDLPISMPLKVSDLPAKKPTRFAIEPDGAQLAAIAAEVGAEEIRKLRFAGELRPAGRHDFILEATLGATAVQACVVTLAPVVTRIEEPVVRKYMAEMPVPEGDEVEMPEDDSMEPLPPVIDLGAVLLEALALALPLYPRAEGVAPADIVVTEPGALPLDDDKIKPFAGLAALRDRLKSDNEGDK